MELPPVRPSRTLSVRVSAVLIDALAAQLPPDIPSVNAWASLLLASAIDPTRLTNPQRHEWKLAAVCPMRRGRK